EFSGGFKFDTSLPGNSNQGHEYRNLTIDELERLTVTPWDGQVSLDKRWAKALGVPVESFTVMPAARRWELTREATRKALCQPGTRGVMGVLGPEFNEDERRALVEYLKSL